MHTAYDADPKMSLVESPISEQARRFYGAKAVGFEFALFDDHRNAQNFYAEMQTANFLALTLDREHDGFVVRYRLR